MKAVYYPKLETLHNEHLNARSWHPNLDLAGIDAEGQWLAYVKLPEIVAILLVNGYADIEWADGLITEIVYQRDSIVCKIFGVN